MSRNYQELGLNLQKIVNRLIANDDLINLLYYTDIDPFCQSICILFSCKLNVNGATCGKYA
jgi:hypothetical protein